MEISGKKAIKGRLMLLIATLIWGTSFFILKNTLDELPVFFIHAMRFSIGSGIMLIGIRKKYLKINKRILFYGILGGAALFAAEALQTYGLLYTTPSKNAFLTITYCIFVPFFTWIVYKKRPSWTVFLAAAICILGIGCISLNGSLEMGIGDALSLSCGIFYAIHILILDKARDVNVILLCLIQFAVCGLLCWIASPIAGESVDITSISPEGWLTIVYMGVFCSGLCFFFQAVGQKNTPPAQASIILLLESVFGTLFSGIFWHETFTAKTILGFALVFFAVFISEAGPYLFRSKRGKLNENN